MTETQQKSNNQEPKKSLDSQDKDGIINSLENAKGMDIVALEVSHLTSIADFIIVVSGTSNRHLQTLAETAIADAKNSGTDVIGVEGLGNSEWVVVDFGDIILHVMSPSAREFYNIEGLWDIQEQ